MVFVVDSTLGFLAPEVERFSPTGGLPNAVQGFEPEDAGRRMSTSSPPGPRSLMLAWIGALFSAGAALLARDVD